jgi:ClpP class serine protease
MKRVRYIEEGCLAIDANAWGGEFAVVLGGALDAKPFAIEGQAAVVSIVGPLTQHPVFVWDSYDAIRERVKAALESEAPTVVLRIDSPGGEAAGCFELARELRAMARGANKPLLAFTDAMAASAAYAIASAADRIVVTSTGIVGSIGVIEMMVDETARDRAMGLNVIAVTSGARKTDKNPHVAITKDAVAEVQSKVDQMAALFFDLVGEMREVGAEKVREIDAAMHFGAGAVRAGLADQVLTWTELLYSLDTAQPGATSAQSTSAAETKHMGKYLDEAKVALRRAAEDEDDEEMKKKAAKALKALEDDDEKKDKEEEKEAKAKAEEEDTKKKDDEAKAKAKAEEDEKEKAKARAQAAASPAFDLAARVQQLEAERAAEREAIAREKLLAKRPDFSGAILATLQTMPLDKLEEAVEKWPKIVGAVRPAAAAQAMGTRGAGQLGDPAEAASVPPTEADFIDRKMGLKAVSGTIKSEARTLELGPLTPEQVDKRIKELDAQKGAA